VGPVGLLGVLVVPVGGFVVPDPCGFVGVFGAVKETGGLSVRGPLTTGVFGGLKLRTLVSGERGWVFVLGTRLVFGVRNERGVFVFGTFVFGVRKERGVFVLGARKVRGVFVLGTTFVFGAKKLRVLGVLVLGARKVRGLFVLGTTLVLGAKKLFVRGAVCVFDGARKF